MRWEIEQITSADAEGEIVGVMSLEDEEKHDDDIIIAKLVDMGVIEGDNIKSDQFECIQDHFDEGVDSIWVFAKAEGCRKVPVCILREDDFL